MSVKLYQYLCEKFGSERVVKVRRLFIDILNYVMNNEKSIFCTIISGSKAEGLDMPGSDVDIMYVIKTFPVHVLNEVSTINTSKVLMADTVNAAAGFAILRILHEETFKHLADCTPHGRVLSNVKFKKFIQFHLTGGIFNLHGPCITTSFQEYDYAFCFKSLEWPPVANKWIQRPRTSGWPSTDLISEIVDQGVIFVPIGSKFGSPDDNPHEWRLSFSVAEKILIHSFNHTQLLCYAMLKILLKEVIQKAKNVNSLLCSYFMKTVLFWVMEELHSHKWIPQKLFVCFKLCLKRLLYFIKYAFCPNYFVTENNMFEGKITDAVKEQLFRCIHFSYEHGIYMFTNSESLLGFIVYNKQIELENFKVREVSVDKGTFPLLYICNNSLEASTLKRIEDITKFPSTKLTRQIFSVVFAILCQEQSLDIQYDLNASNKILYLQYKSCQALNLIGTNSDVSGWFLLALLFYQHKQYHRALTVVNYVLSECTPDKILIGLSQRYQSYLTPYQGFKFSFRQRLKLSCIHQRVFSFSKKGYMCGIDFSVNCCFLTVIYLMILGDITGKLTFPKFTCRSKLLEHFFGVFFHSTDKDVIWATSVAFAHFFCFMCYHHLDDISRKEYALQNLRVTVTENYLIDCTIVRTFAFLYLQKALILSKCYKEASHFVQNIKKHVHINGLPDFVKKRDPSLD